MIRTGVILIAASILSFVAKYLIDARIVKKIQPFFDEEVVSYRKLHPLSAKYIMREIEGIVMEMDMIQKKLVLIKAKKEDALSSTLSYIMIAFLITGIVILVISFSTN